MRNYHTFEEECGLLRWGSHQLLDRSKKRSFSDLPPELLHWILGFVVRDFKDLIVFSTINLTCKNVADYSLLWLEIDLSFKFPERFTSTIRLGSHSDFFIPLDLPDRYSLPTNYSIHIIRPNINSSPFSARGTNRHQIANTMRKKFMACVISYLKKADEYLLYYQRAQRIRRMCNWNHDTFIYFVGISIIWLYGSIYLLYDFEINTHLSVSNHIGFLGIFYTILLYTIRFFFLLVEPLSIHVLKSVYLNGIFDNFQWKMICTSAMNFVLSFGILSTVFLAYIKCIKTSLISYWWVTTIPIWIATILSLRFLAYRHQTCCEEAGYKWIEVAIALYLINGIFLVPLLFSLYFDDPTDHFRIRNSGCILFLVFPLFLVISMSTILLAIYYFQSIIFVGCLHCEYLTNARVDLKWNNAIAIGLLLFAIMLTIILNYALLGLSISCFLIENHTWDRTILFGLHFSPLLYALLTLSTGTTLLLTTFSIQDHTKVLR